MEVNRRQFTKIGALTALGVALAPVLTACGESEGDNAAGTGREGPELRFSHVQPDNHYTSDAVRWMDEQLQGTEGAPSIRLFAGGALGGPDETITALNSGDVAFTWVSTGQLAREVPALNVFGAPYVVKSRDHYRALATPGSAPYDEIKAAIEAAIPGVMMVGMFGGPARQLYTTGEPVATPSDLSGRRIRIEDSPVKARAWEAFGATPVPLAWSEIYTALQSNVIAGAESSTDAYHSNAFFEVAPQLSLTAHEYTVLPLLASRKALESLDSEMQEMVLEKAKEASTECWSIGWKKDDDLVNGGLANEGVTVTEPDTEEFASRVAELSAEVAKEYKAEALLEAVNSLA